MVKDNLRRRDFLKETGLATGIGTLGVQTVRANVQGPKNEVRYLEVGVEHNLEHPETTGSPATYPIDEPVRHAIGPDNEALHLKKSMPDEVVSRVKNAEQVVKISGNGYHSFTAAVLGATPTRTINVRLGDHYRRLEAMILEDEYQLPAIDIQHDVGDDVSISVNGSKTVVSAGDEREVTLESANVSTTFQTVTDEKLTRQGVPSRKEPLKKERTTKTIAVTPSVKVQNYGKIDLIDSTHTNAPL